MDKEILLINYMTFQQKAYVSNNLHYFRITGFVLSDTIAQGGILCLQVLRTHPCRQANGAEG